MNVLLGVLGSAVKLQFLSPEGFPALLSVLKPPVLCVCEHSGWFHKRSALYFRLHMANRPSHYLHLKYAKKNKSTAFDLSTLFMSKDSFKTVFLNDTEAPKS